MLNLLCSAGVWSTLYQHGVWLWSLCTHRGLAACSKDGADPYISFILLPDKKGATKRRTATKKRDLNPEFNERQDEQMRNQWQWKESEDVNKPAFVSLLLYRFDFDFSLEESIQKRLDLSVKNSVSFMSRERELIGKVYIIMHVLDTLNNCWKNT